jgi:hypothetical protein
MNINRINKICKIIVRLLRRYGWFERYWKNHFTWVWYANVTVYVEHKDGIREACDILYYPDYNNLEHPDYVTIGILNEIFNPNIMSDFNVNNKYKKFIDVDKKYLFLKDKK